MSGSGARYNPEITATPATTPSRPALRTLLPSLCTLATWGPAAVLTIVALLQIVMVYRADLTPWEGGGFGMFSTLDYETNRRFLVEGMDQKGEGLQVNLFAGDQRRHSRLRIKPDRKEIERLAEELLQTELIPDKQEQVKVRLGMASAWRLRKAVEKQSAPLKLVRVKSPDVEIDPKEILRLKAVRLSLWRKKFDTINCRLSW